MGSEQNDEPFLFTVQEVFHLAGRNGTTVVEPIKSGVIRSRDRVEVWRDDQPVARATAFVDFTCSREPRPIESYSLLLTELTGSDAQIADEIRLALAWRRSIPCGLGSPPRNRMRCRSHVDLRA